MRKKGVTGGGGGGRDSQVSKKDAFVIVHSVTGLFGGGLSVTVNNVFTFYLSVLTLLFTFLLIKLWFLSHFYAICLLITIVMHHVMLAFTVVSSTF